MTRAPAPASNVDDLFALLERSRGFSDSLDGGDRIDILAHSLQCAEVLSRVAPDDAELQIAGLVHDIGHVLVPGDAPGHGRHGGEYVRAVLGDRVARLVDLHVVAKRYLVTTDPAYRADLSLGSTRSLALQGGDLTAEELVVLDADPHLADALTLRRADESAKAPERRVAPLESWRATAEAVARVARAGS